MSDGSCSLVYDPRSATLEQHPGTYLLTDPNRFVLYRAFGRDLGFKAAHAQVGAGLLPEPERPTSGQCIKLLWVPLLPSRCLFVAEDASGSPRIAARPVAPHPPLSLALEHMEVECAWAFDEMRGRSANPPPRLVVCHLDEALSLAIEAILLMREQVGDDAFWREVAS